MKKRILLLPSFGILCFIGLYLFAAAIYPNGFDWLRNYWCDLFDYQTPDGQQNPARPVAIAAMPLLCGSYALLWWWLPKLFETQHFRLQLARIFGVISMLLTATLFIFHEFAINIGSFLGGVALVLTFIELYQAGQKQLFAIGVLCLILSCINYFIYQTKIGLPLLASLQKVAFFIFSSGVWG
jgi:hypothetical protein